MTTLKNLNIKIINPVAHEFYTQKENYDSDSGLDLYILEDVVVQLGETKMIDLGIQCEMIVNAKPVQTIPSQDIQNHADTYLPYYLYPRSSFSKTPLIMGNHVGIIDKSYRGNIMGVVKFMPTLDIWNQYIQEGLQAFKTTYTIKKGTRLFQICANDLMPFSYTLVDTLSDTKRGTKGLGSTGK